MSDRPTRYLAIKECIRCHETKEASLFHPVRAGGTADVCKACHRRRTSESMIAKHRKADELFRKQQEEHFAANLKREQERWDSLPDGHPYKAPRRPGS